MTMAIADKILLGHVITLDHQNTQVEAVAIAQGRIVAVGTRSSVLELRGAHTQIYDFGTASLIPGFNDAHAHLDTVGTRFVRPSLEGLRSIPEVLERVRELVRATPKGEWIVTMPVGDPPYYFDGNIVLREGRLPDRYELDSVSPDHPVYIPAPSGYWGQPPIWSTMNSLALQRNGIGRDTVPATPATVICKDANGEPTGIFEERSFVNTLEADLLPAVPRFTYDERRDGVRRGLRAYHEAGTTSIYEGHGCAPEIIAAYRELWEHGDLTMRTALALSPRWRSLEDAAISMRDWMSLFRGRGTGDAMFRASGLFIAHGGDPCVTHIHRKAIDHMGWSGFVAQVNSTEEFEELCMIAGECDLRVHTIASDKIAKVAPVLERVGQHFPIGERRWVVEHISRSDDASLATLKRLGLCTTLIPSQYLWKHGTPFLGLDAGEQDYVSPAKQLFDLDVPVGIGTDGSPENPLFCLWAMTTRTERTTSQTLGPNGIVTNEAGLKMLTRGGAWLTFEENEKGQLSPGQYADIAVLSGDPLSTTGDALLDIRCIATMVDGRWVFSSNNRLQ